MRAEEYEDSINDERAHYMLSVSLVGVEGRQVPWALSCAIVTPSRSLQWRAS